MDGLIAYALAKKGSVASLNGTGAPSASLVAKKGDLYLDTTDNQLYVCTDYISSNVTDLTGLTVVFNSVLNSEDAATYDGNYYVTYKIPGSTFPNNDNTVMEIRNQYSDFFYGGSQNATVYTFSTSSWYAEYWRTVTFSGGTDIANSKFVSFVLRNAVIQGTGSTWKLLDSELPDVTSYDEGKVLKVNAQGQWDKGDESSSGTVTFSGSGAPTGSILAKEGDLYRDTRNNKVYMCSQYVNPLAITNLKGLTVTLPNPMPLPTNGFDDVSYQFGGTYTATLKIDEISPYGTVSRTFNHYLMSTATLNSTVITTTWSSGAWNRTLFSDSQTNLYGQSTSNVSKVIIYFPDNVDVTNEKLIKWMVSNAIDIEGAGAIWVELIAVDSRVPAVSGTDNGKLMGVNNGAWAVVNAPTELPSTSSSDNGKLLGVSGGAWTKIGSTIPTSNGVYVLKCTVSNGSPTYSWVSSSDFVTEAFELMHSGTSGPDGTRFYDWGVIKEDGEMVARFEQAILPDNES